MDRRKRLCKRLLGFLWMSRFTRAAQLRTKHFDPPHLPTVLSPVDMPVGVMAIGRDDRHDIVVISVDQAVLRISMKARSPAGT